MDHKSTHSLSLALLVFILSASFYLYEYTLQVAPSVMTFELMHAFRVNAGGLGALSAFYFYAYAPMQLPAGILFDRYGPRCLMTLALCVCALGALFFALAGNVMLAAIGRFFIGIGSAFSFVGVLVIIARWFSPVYFAMLVGVTQMMSSVGAIFGGMPLARLTNHIGWRSAMIFLSAIGLILAILMWRIVRDYPDGRKQYKLVRATTFAQEFKKLLTVCKHPQTWSVALYAFAIWAPVTVFAALWGVPFLMSKYYIDNVMASQMCAMFWIGIGIGSPLFGWWSDKIKTRCLPLSVCAVLGLVSSMVVLYFDNLSWIFMHLGLFVMGLASAGQTVSFAVVKENNPVNHLGTACGFNNFAVLFGGALFQPLVGFILQSNWDHVLYKGAPIYSMAAYQRGLWLLPVCYLIALLVSLWGIRETHAVPFKEKTAIPKEGDAHGTPITGH